MSRKSDGEEWLAVGALALGAWWLTRGEGESGGLFGWLDKLFGAKPATRFEPLPDWKLPEYQPTEIEITPKNTPASFGKMGLAYARGFRTIFGKKIPRHVLGMLLAQSALETANWGKGFWEWNPANITTARPRGFYMLPNDASLPREQRHKYAPYPDAQTGAQAHIATLMRVHQPAWDLILANGSPEDVARSLKTTRFYESDAEGYAQGMRGEFDQIMRKLPQYQEPPPVT